MKRRWFFGFIPWKLSCIAGYMLGVQFQRYQDGDWKITLHVVAGSVYWLAMTSWPSENGREQQ